MKANRKWDARCRYSEEDIETICQMKKDNPKMPYREIAEKFDLSIMSVSRIIRKNLTQKEA